MFCVVPGIILYNKKSIFGWPEQLLSIFFTINTNVTLHIPEDRNYRQRAFLAGNMIFFQAPQLMRAVVQS